MTNTARYLFTGVKVAYPAMDQKYYNPKKGVIGAWSFDLNVLLQTNMDLYVSLPGKKTVDASVPQLDDTRRSGRRWTSKASTLL